MHASSPRPSSKKRIIRSTYSFTRIVILRALSAVYFIAFLISYNQNEGLLGNNGLLPANQYFLRLKRHVQRQQGTSPATSLDCFLQFPSILWFLDFEGQHVFYYLQQCALCGMTLSILVFFYGRSNSIIMAMLWMLYFSIDTFGQEWFSFGWESQLLETGFIAIFLVPLFPFQNTKINGTSASVEDMGWIQYHVDNVAIYAYWWLIFRIMIGAGLIKIRGDPCWLDLTCMNYHYETQPVPNPLSYYLHHNYQSFHRFETMVNHIVELVTPWFMFFGRKLILTNALIQITFQIVLIISGNLSFLNWLTIIPSLAFLDDKFLLHFKFLWTALNGSLVQATHETKSSSSTSKSLTSRTQNVVLTLNRFRSLAFAILITYLSIPVVQNLLALHGHQAMNKSFHNFKLVNTYGAFGSITKRRTEVILQGTLDDIHSLDPNSAKGNNIQWREYEFKCKPGNINKRPCIISPYHYRLDWLMWFAAFGSYQQHPWILHLTSKLLSNQTEINSHVQGLLAHNPFNETHPPKYIRAEHYEYRFTKPTSSDGRWWSRKRIGSYFPPVSLDNPSFRKFGERVGIEYPSH